MSEDGNHKEGHWVMRRDSQCNVSSRMERTIRLARVAEAPAAADILAEAAEWTKRFGPPIWSAEEIHSDNIVDAASSGALVVGIEQRTIVACMQVYDRDPIHWPNDRSAALYLHKLAVRRSGAGKGWLRDLLGWAMRHAKMRNAQLVRLDTLPAGPLPELYGRFGFRLVDQEPQLFNGRLLVRMERSLPRPPQSDVVARRLRA